MSNTSNAPVESEQASLQLAIAQTDALLKEVNEQMTLGTFDSENKEVLARLVESLGDTRGLVRLRCAETLGEIGKPATPFLLEALANHPNVVVRRAAAKTLTLIADPVTVPNLLHAFLNDEDTVVRGSSVGAMARIGEPSVTSLLEILADSNLPESTKGHAAWALAFIGAEAKEYLYKALDSDSVDVRCAVIGAIAKVAQEEPKADLFEILIKALTDSNVDVRCEAAAVLGNLAYQPAMPNLIELLDYQDGDSRKSAALALMKMSDRAALEPLNNALVKETETGVQNVIKLAISQIEKSLLDQ
ncbi:HEAT repeat domain-containing protein [Calothrix sp. PCC 6303]|uniref:HEAT repeat domain-containing protein n=1 Tax=Calothrix sp. PCC 6303 TaxID=1170562 RepID=UPI0002A0045C|nr:HEAT repeat domain-containing protein [Calothrix sp. PCC 6303]AFZ00070.1 PBS lyase HEAT domain protein repeat-containing protein [Calothrix sp. PCC 6303]